MSGANLAPQSLGRVVGIFAGGPKTLHDARGEWVSSIAREPVSGPARLEMRGLAGDQATQPYHGTTDLAVCLHSLTHYLFWNAHYGLHLGPGGVGENLTIGSSEGDSVCDETQICIGDVFQIGTARLQISGPRTPCENQARHVGRADWVRLSLETMRTGMYARVLAPGSLAAGDDLLLVERPNPGLTVQDLVRCYYHTFEAELAFRLMMAEGLADRWQDRFEKRLRAGSSREAA